MLEMKIKPDTKLKDYKGLDWYMLHTDTYVVPYYDLKADMYSEWTVLRIWKDSLYRVHVDIAYSSRDALRRKYVRS